MDTTQVSRAGHLQWCKSRALEYSKRGDLSGALASMFSDLQKHDETAKHPGIMLGTMLLMSGNLNTQTDVEKFIQDFN